MPRPRRRNGPGGAGAGPVVITPRVLDRLPLPQPDDEADKEERGRVLVVGGSVEMPGAVILAAVAALRAGAGKLRIATVGSVAPIVGGAIPEARVLGLPETAGGAIDPAAAEQVADCANGTEATLIGPGMIDDAAVRELLHDALPRIERPTLVLDAAAMTCFEDCGPIFRSLRGELVLTPHAGEMAVMLGVEREAVRDDPLGTVRRAAAVLRATVALKGAETLIVGPDGAAYRNRSGNVALATSGSGDTLSGIIAGLAARGASPIAAAAWGVYLHGGAGDRLAERVGPLGFLARELLAEIPALLAELSGRKSG